MENKVNDKQKALLESAEAMFFKHGIRRVSIEEICKRAGVSRMTFYKHFRNKQELACRVLDGRIQEGLRQYQAIMAKDLPFHRKVELILEMKLTYSRGLSEFFLRDLYGEDPTLQQYRDRLIADNRRFSLELLEQGQREGVIRADLEPDFYLYMLDHVNALMKDERLQAIFPDYRERAGELVKFWFYGMFDAIG